MDKQKDKGDKVTKEVRRLKTLFKDMPDKQRKLTDGLIIQAARLRVLLDEMWLDIEQGGDYELFTQSEKTPAYERERPIAKLYNTRDQNYQRIIKQLTDLLPEESKETVAETEEESYRKAIKDLI